MATTAQQPVIAYPVRLEERRIGLAERTRLELRLSGETASIRPSRSIGVKKLIHPGVTARHLRRRAYRDPVRRGAKLFSNRRRTCRAVPLGFGELLTQVPSVCMVV